MQLPEVSAITFIKNLFSRSALWKNSTYDVSTYVIKVAFFQKVRFVCQNSKKKFQITILNLKFKFPANNSKQLIQIGSLMPSKILPLFDINVHKAVVCLALPR
jgi:hypothetical protein